MKILIKILAFPFAAIYYILETIVISASDMLIKWKSDIQTVKSTVDEEIIEIKEDIDEELDNLK